jgi:predicted nucleic-acid-binding protein
MRAVDTNVLVRLIARDDPAQVTAATQFVSTGAWVSHVVLVEVIGVLASVYHRDAASLARTIDFLLKHQDLTIQDADVVVAAVQHYRARSALGFSDCLILEIARKAGHIPIGTFDRTFAKLDGTERIAA